MAMGTLVNLLQNVAPSDLQAERVNISRLPLSGSVIDPDAGMELAITQAGLDYTLGTVPNVNFINGEYRKVLDSKVVYRLDENGNPDHQIATVGADYTPVQPYTTAEFISTIAGFGGKWVRGGTIGYGAKMFMEIEVGQIQIADDKITGFILGLDSADGTGAFKVYGNERKFFCSNQLAGFDKNIIVKYSHTANVDARIRAARTAIKNEMSRLQRLKVLGEELLQIQFREERFSGLVEHLVPMTEDMATRGKNIALDTRSAFWQALSAPDLANVQNTGWAAWQAIADVATHLHKVNEKPEKQIKRDIETITAPKFTNEALAYILN